MLVEPDLARPLEHMKCESVFYLSSARGQRMLEKESQDDGVGNSAQLKVVASLHLSLPAPQADVSTPSVWHQTAGLSTAGLHPAAVATNLFIT